MMHIPFVCTLLAMCSWRAFTTWANAPDAGHYRAFVSGFSERNKKKFHIFDDNVQAVIATESDVQTLCRNCYLLYFVQRHS